MDRASIQVALTGERPLSHDELTSSFYQLLRRVEQEEAYTHHMRDVILFNNDILDQCTQRTNGLHLHLNTVPAKFKQGEEDFKRQVADMHEQLKMSTLSVF